MNTIEISTQILNDIKIIENDESKMQRLAKYVKRLLPKKEDDSLLTKEEFFAKIDRAIAQSKRGEGKVFTSKEELHKYLESL